MAAGLTWDEDGGEELGLEKLSVAVCAVVVFEVVEVVVVVVAVAAELCMSSRNLDSLASDCCLVFKTDLAFFGRTGSGVKLLLRSSGGYSEYLVRGSTSCVPFTKFTLVEMDEARGGV